MHGFERLSDMCFVTRSVLRLTMTENDSMVDANARAEHGYDFDVTHNVGHRVKITVPSEKEEKDTFFMAATLWKWAKSGDDEISIRRTNFAELWDECLAGTKAMIVPITIMTDDTGEKHAAHLIVYKEDDGSFHIVRTAMNADELQLKGVNVYGRYAALDSFFGAIHNMESTREQTLVYEGLASNAAALRHPGLCSIISPMQALEAIGLLVLDDDIVKSAQHVFSDILVDAYERRILSNPDIEALRKWILTRRRRRPRR